MGLQFYLNDELVTIKTPRGDQTVLDYLREERRLKGTKEGCAEGDCGACTVLIGQLRNGELHYHSLNSCIAFLPMLHGAHLVTIEALSANGSLHWVQEALVKHHGSQCGFCTPGIVMSLYAAWMNAKGSLNYEDVQIALQGNLCRCTGYAPIMRGIVAEQSNAERALDPLVLHRADMVAKLKALKSEMLAVQGDAAFYIPQNLTELEAVVAMNPNATIVAGATDVGIWVTKRFRNIAPIIFLHQVDELYAIDVSGDEIKIGAMASFEDVAQALATVIPELAEFWTRIAGMQVRQTGTIGGNIANGSPIGDSPPIWIVLGAKLHLNHGGVRRKIAIEDYFVEYGKQDLRSGEFIEALTFARSEAKVEAYKVSKRRDDDISAVMVAMLIERAGDKIASARIAFGGMAGTPKRARQAEELLTQNGFSEDSFRKAMKSLEGEFQPLSDMRASADYRMKVAQNLLLRYFVEYSEAKAEA